MDYVINVHVLYMRDPVVIFVDISLIQIWQIRARLINQHLWQVQQH